MKPTNELLFSNFEKRSLHKASQKSIEETQTPLQRLNKQKFESVKNSLK